MFDVYQRIMDIVVSLLTLIVGIPLIIIFSLLIVIETPGPAFYVQERVGKNGKVFNLYKLRSMILDAEKNGAQWASKDDKRISRVGRIIRKARIDELPQLFNVLKGDMSFIGPRPEREIFIEEFSKEMPEFVKRLQVKPGLTGWAQVNGGYDLTPREKWELDMYYIENRGFKLDLIILFKTVRVVLTGEGAR